MERVAAEGAGSRRQCCVRASEQVHRLLLSPPGASRDYAGCVTELRRYLALPTALWKEERAAAYRHISQCHIQLGNNAAEGSAERLEEYTKAQNAALQAVLETLENRRQDRDPWLQLAFASRMVASWQTAYWAAKKALEITERHSSSFETGTAWGAEPYDELAQAAFALGFYEEAAAAGDKAAELEPSNQRLTDNLRFYRGALAGGQGAEEEQAADAAAAASAAQAKLDAVLRGFQDDQKKVRFGCWLPSGLLRALGEPACACRHSTPTMPARPPRLPAVLRGAGGRGGQPTR